MGVKMGDAIYIVHHKSFISGTSHRKINSTMTIESKDNYGRVVINLIVIQAFSCKITGKPLVAK